VEFAFLTIAKVMLRQLILGPLWEALVISVSLAAQPSMIL
jgi:hypothetical protein